jgi:hypothetical protein
LPIPGTRQQHHLAFAVFRLRPLAKQQIQFLFAAHQRRQRVTITTGIEAALRLGAAPSEPTPDGLWRGRRCLKIFGGEMTQVSGTDVVLAEGSLVSFKT